jgi:hypothetical protein
VAGAKARVKAVVATPVVVLVVCSGGYCRSQRRLCLRISTAISTPTIWGGVAHKSGEPTQEREMTHLNEADLRRAAQALSAPYVLEFLPPLGLSPEEASSVHAVAGRVAEATISSGEAAPTSPRVLGLVHDMDDEAVAALDLLMWLAAEYLPNSSTRLAIHLWTTEIVEHFAEHAQRTPPALSASALSAVEVVARAFQASERSGSMQRLSEEADRRDTQAGADPLSTVFAMIHQRYFGRFAAGVRRALDEAELRTLEKWASGIVGRELPLP